MRRVGRCLACFACESHSRTLKREIARPAPTCYARFMRTLMSMGFAVKGAVVARPSTPVAA